jgi:hypothetical protein
MIGIRPSRKLRKFCSKQTFELPGRVRVMNISRSVGACPWRTQRQGRSCPGIWIDLSSFLSPKALDVSVQALRADSNAAVKGLGPICHRQSGLRS